MNIDIWTMLKKELSYYGIILINDKECGFYSLKDTLYTQGIIKTIRQLRKSVENQKEILRFLWKGVVELLKEESHIDIFCDDKIKKLFIYSVKDMILFLSCFEETKNGKLYDFMDGILNRDISSFNREQIYRLPDYKICIDWVHRVIERLLYLIKLLSSAVIGKRNINKHVMKFARGISGPWANLDLPLLERVYPFEDEELFGRRKDKERQRRYTKGLENYNNDGSTGEGHYWREIRNEPYSWENREWDSPYPSRSQLMR